MGGEGLKSVSGNAVLNANYIMEALKDTYYLPYDRRCMHEVVFSADWQLLHEPDVSFRHFLKNSRQCYFHEPISNCSFWSLLPFRS